MEKGSERVKSWVYTVINPLEDNLLYETQLLENENISWRYSIMKMEFIKTCDKYINNNFYRNYNDFLASKNSKNIKEQIETHDSNVAQLNEQAKAFAIALQQSMTFGLNINNFLKEYDDRYHEYPGGNTEKA